jgi:hypothetical protein
MVLNNSTRKQHWPHAQSIFWNDAQNLAAYFHETSVFMKTLQHVTCTFCVFSTWVESVICKLKRILVKQTLSSSTSFWIKYFLCSPGLKMLNNMKRKTTSSCETITDCLNRHIIHIWCLLPHRPCWAGLHYLNPNPFSGKFLLRLGRKSRHHDKQKFQISRQFHSKNRKYCSKVAVKFRKNCGIVNDFILDHNILTLILKAR